MVMKPIVFAAAVLAQVPQPDAAINTGTESAPPAPPTDRVTEMDHDHDGDGVQDHKPEDHVDGDDHDHDGDGVQDHKPEDHVDGDAGSAPPAPPTDDPVTAPMVIVKEEDLVATNVTKACGYEFDHESQCTRISKLECANEKTLVKGVSKEQDEQCWVPVGAKIRGAECECLDGGFDEKRDCGYDFSEWGTCERTWGKECEQKRLVKELNFKYADATLTCTSPGFPLEGADGHRSCTECDLGGPVKDCNYKFEDWSVCKKDLLATNGTCIQTRSVKSFESTYGASCYESRVPNSLVDENGAKVGVRDCTCTKSGDEKTSKESIDTALKTLDLKSPLHAGSLSEDRLFNLRHELEKSKTVEQFAKDLTDPNKKVEILNDLAMPSIQQFKDAIDRFLEVNGAEVVDAEVSADTKIAAEAIAKNVTDTKVTTEAEVASKAPEAAKAPKAAEKPVEVRLRFLQEGEHAPETKDAETVVPEEAKTKGAKTEIASTEAPEIEYNLRDSTVVTLLRGLGLPSETKDDVLKSLLLLKKTLVQQEDKKMEGEANVEGGKKDEEKDEALNPKADADADANDGDAEPEASLKAGNLVHAGASTMTVLFIAAFVL